MRSIAAFCLLQLLYLPLHAQHKSYRDSLENFQKNYVETHEVVKGPDREYFHFFKIDPKYKVIARFEKLLDTTGFIMKTSGPRKTTYFRYGMLYFTINKIALQLTIYQSQRLLEDSVYHNYLFVPFTDLTSGEKSYGGGRYLDFFTGDIKNNYLTVDFNKAYNPYCAYASGYSCPIPPRENDLEVNIEAGEKNYLAH
jgi:uncharacterized protein (DUF1684 family)